MKVLLVEVAEGIPSVGGVRCFHLVAVNSKGVLLRVVGAEARKLFSGVEEQPVYLFHGDSFSRDDVIRWLTCGVGAVELFPALGECALEPSFVASFDVIVEVSLNEGYCCMSICQKAGYRFAMLCFGFWVHSWGKMHCGNGERVRVTWLDVHAQGVFFSFDLPFFLGCAADVHKDYHASSSEGL